MLNAFDALNTVFYIAFVNRIQFTCSSFLEVDIENEGLDMNNLIKFLLTPFLNFLFCRRGIWMEI